MIRFKPLLAILALAATLMVLPGPVTARDAKTLTVARTGQFDSLDPPRQFDVQSTALVSMVYSALFRYAYLERPFKLEPDLLERMPDLSADKLTYTFKLVKGVHFHDNKCFPGGKGRELTADDVLFSLRRFADANVNHGSWSLIEGAVVGLDAYRAATLKAGPNGDTSKLPIEGLKKLDSHTLSIRLTKPNPLFLFALGTPVASIYPAEAVRMYGDQFGIHPVGTGPFTLTDVERKGVLRLLKNPHYHGSYPTLGAPGDLEKGLLKDAGKRLPLVDVVEMPLIEEAQPGILKFLKGELDWSVLDHANFTKMAVKTGDANFKLKDEFAGKFSIQWTPDINVYHTAFNMKDPLLGSNKKLRQALANLVDTQATIDLLDNGRGRRLKSIVPHAVPGNERETGAHYYSYDLAQAKRLLAEAGYPGGKGLPPLSVIYYSSTVAFRNKADLTKAKFAAAGVQLVAVHSDLPTFMRALDNGNFQIAECDWIADYPDAEDFYLTLYSKNAAPGPNSASFSNAAYDKAYEASRYLANGPERLALFKTMNEIIVEEVPIVVGYNRLTFGVTQKWVQNLQINPMATEIMYMDVDMDLKKKGVP